MAIELLEAFASELLEHNNLVCPYRIIKNGGCYHSALDVGSTDFDFALILEKEHLVKLYTAVFGLRKAVHEKFISGFHLELLACNFYDCVHVKKLKKF